jgi:hypothetical protein
MGKSRSNRRTTDETVWVHLDEIVISDSTWNKLVHRDFGQIEQMRVRYEDGLDMVRVVLHDRFDGGYTVEDGRHRVIAAKLAGESFIEALIVSR